MGFPRQEYWSRLPFLPPGQRCHLRRQQKHTKEAPTQARTWGHTGERAGVDPGSESLPPPRETIAAASPGRWGGRAAQRPARPAPCDARSTRSPGGAADGRVFRPTWNTFRKTNAVPPTSEQVRASWDPTRNRKRRRRGYAG